MEGKLLHIHQQLKVHRWRPAPSSLRAVAIFRMSPKASPTSTGKARPTAAGDRTAETAAAAGDEADADAGAVDVTVADTVGMVAGTEEEEDGTNNGSSRI